MNNFSLRCSTFLFLILLIGFSSIAQSIQEKKISGIYKNVPLKDFFNELGQKEQIKTFYKDQWIDSVTINYTFKHLPLVQVFNKIFEKSQLKYEIFQNNAIIIYPKTIEQTRAGTKSQQFVVVIGDPLNEGRYKKAIIRGEITDGATGEKLPGAVIYSSVSNKGVTTNAMGEYEIELPTGEHELQISFIGFEPNKQKIKLIETGNADFELYEETHNLGEVTVVADEKKVARTQMSMVKVNSKILKELPVLMGEADIIKSIIMMPGIQTVGELSSGFNVRGGNADQNLILLNGSPVFNSSHLFGFFSMINPDVVKDVTLFKGGIPASYGERISSVMEVGIKDGNNDKLILYGGIGLISSRLTIEGPILKWKNSNFIIGGRSTYSDWLLQKINNVNFKKSVANFYDINAKFNLSLGNKNHLELMGYKSFDSFNLNSGTLYNYGNLLASLNWKYNITNKFISEFKLAYSQYSFDLKETKDDLGVEDYILKMGIDYTSAHYQLSYLHSEKHRMNIGAKYIKYLLRPGEIVPSQETTVIVPERINNEKTFESGIYIDDEFDFLEKWTFNLGIRYSQYANLGESIVYIYDPNYTKDLKYRIDSLSFGNNEKIKEYSGIEPRISLKYNLPNESSIRMSYQKINQYIHQISNTSIVSPADFWKSSDYYIKPLKSDQIALGFFKKFQQQKFETSIEMYYKNLQNLPEYKNGANLIMNQHLETEMVLSNGYSYGLEIFAKKATGRLNGWISYTYSRTMRKTDNIFHEETINKGKYFPSIYDKPHDISIIANYQISRRWRFSSNFVLSSGRPVTLPELKYSYRGTQLVYFSDRNKYRMPPYHRLDISITLDENLKKKRTLKGSWTFSIYNLYGRKNPYSVYYKRNSIDMQASHGLYSLYKLSIVGIPIPSITYNFKF